jgi:hypothetical protein
LCLDSGYYDTFNRPNVHLVDLRKTPLVEFTPTGEFRQQCDAVAANGYEGFTLITAGEPAIA